MFAKLIEKTVQYAVKSADVVKESAPNLGDKAIKKYEAAKREVKFAVKQGVLNARSK